MDRIVCTPILSFIVLLKILFSNKNKSSIIYFELFPFYLRFIIKFFSVPEETIINFFKIIFKIELKKIKHGDEIENYNNIRLNTYNNITNLFDSLLKIINKSDAYFLLNNLIDKDSTKSSIIKYFSKNQMHLYLLSGIICDNISKNKVDLFVPNHWDKFILNEISKNKFFSNISLKKEPYILSIFQILNSNIKIIFYLIRSIFIHGIKFNSIKKKSPKISTEIFDPNLIGSSGVFDSDFFVDNINFKYENSLFYVTKNNYNIFKKNGGDKKKFIDILDKKNIDLIFLQNLSIGYKKYFCMFSFYFKFLISSLKFKSDFILTVYPHIFRDYIDYLPLFENYDIKNHIHLINSNGRGPLLLNSGVITGICRDYKTKSIGIQNRLIDAKHYEFSYDCYDVYFLWGDAWIKLLNSTLIFIKKVKLSGVINISENTLIKNKLLNTKKII